MRHAFTSAVIALIAVLGMSDGAYAAPDPTQCSANASVDARIAACTPIIEAGPKSEYNLALAYKIRCGAFARKGDFKRALADCDDAIKLDRNDAENFSHRCRVRNRNG